MIANVFRCSNENIIFCQRPFKLGFKWVQAVSEMPKVAMDQKEVSNPLEGLQRNTLFIIKSLSNDNSTFEYSLLLT